VVVIAAIPEENTNPSSASSKLATFFATATFVLYFKENVMNKNNVDKCTKIVSVDV
jgi:hypothetical protein